MLTDLVHPLLPNMTPVQSRAIVGAMRSVAESGGVLTAADHIALQSTDRFIFGHTLPLDIDALSVVTPEALAQALHGSPYAEDAAKFLTVMAFIDGALDKAKIATVLRYAEALGVHARYLDQISELAAGHIQAALADMTRCNMESVTNAPWADGDVNAWLLPYTGHQADPSLAARFAALRTLPADTFGHAFWAHFTANGYAFPGDPAALNARFAVPHDTVHVLTGYDTSARGEILASTFTASMHRLHPMAGHVLPVILSWHLKIALNDVARDASGGLDPAEFWHAWVAGAEATVDTFAPGWDFWAWVDEPLSALRTRWSIPAAGLEA